ncbi:FeS-binding protein [uncultured Desulfovibrio sp.]|uniref:FeS-binding protein n=1 Tax=uncultured Desulfovibrio sp. TaxID=167968 RepID=UPI00258E64F2|nr:FeS-binding protein [uncultured Desulfovibrio sp.]
MKEEPCLFSAFFKLLWVAAMLAAIVSGLAHLPFAFRYGLINSWRASPTVAHYWSAAALLLLGTYAAVVWLAAGRRRYALTCLGGLRVTLLVVLAVTGLLLVLHNLPGFSMYGGAYAVIKLSHLFCALALPLLLLLHYCLRLLGRGLWVRPLSKVRRRSGSA